MDPTTKKIDTKKFYGKSSLAQKPPCLSVTGQNSENSAGSSNTSTTTPKNKTQRKKRKTIPKASPKKIKLRVSMESMLFEVDLAKILAKPDTMLGRMFSTSRELAKPNENGEYEMKNVNPTFFENALNYYNNEKISKGHLMQKFSETIDYLQIPLNIQSLDDHFWSDVEEEKIIMENFNWWYDEYIKDLQENENDRSWYTINLISQDRQDDSETCNEPEVDDEYSFKCYVEETTHKHLMQFDDPFYKFLKSKGIEEFRKTTDEVDLEFNTYVSASDYDRFKLEYVVLDIFC